MVEQCALSGSDLKIKRQYYLPLYPTTGGGFDSPQQNLDEALSYVVNLTVHLLTYLLDEGCCEFTDIEERKL